MAFILIHDCIIINFSLTLWVHSDGVCGSNLVHTVHSTDAECVAGPYNKTSTTIAIIRTQLVIET